MLAGGQRGEEVRVGCARGIAVGTTFGAMGRRLPWLERSDPALCRLLAWPPCRTQASSPGCTKRAPGACPGLRPAQLSQVDCFPREPSVAAAERQASGPMAGADLRRGPTCPVQPAPWPSPAFTAFPSSTRQCCLSHQTPQRRATSLHQTPQGRTSSSITLPRAGLCLLQALGLALRPWDQWPLLPTTDPCPGPAPSLVTDGG